MPAPLTHTLGTLDLPRGMVWVDEFDWSAPLRAHEYSITGALIVDQGVRQAGRPITLQAADDQGWMTRATLLQLQALADAAGGPLPLTLADGRTFSVRFAPDSPIAAQPIARPELPPANYPYVVTLRLVIA